MPTGMRNDPLLGCHFLIELDGIAQASFSECSGLQAEIKTESYREGGLNDYAHHFWDGVEYPALVLKRGLIRDSQLWAWYRHTMARHIERKNGTIYLLDRQGETVMRWDFKEAFPVKWVGPELKADSGNVAFESIELRHRGLVSPDNDPDLLAMLLNIGRRLF